MRAIVLILGAVVLGLCVFVLPAAIGEISMDGYDPILLGMYAPAIPFFIALYQAWKLLNYIDKNKAFSDLSVKALKIIKYCAVIISALYAAGIPYIFWQSKIMTIGFVIIFASIVIAAFAALLQKLLQNA